MIDMVCKTTNAKEINQNKVKGIRNTMRSIRAVRVLVIFNG
jgi:hypothetical protein